MKLVLIISFIICSCNSLPWEDTSVIEIKEKFDNDEELVRFNYHEEYNEDSTNTGEEMFIKKSTNLTLGFKWTNCGAVTDPIQLKTLTVSPDPIVIPGAVTVGLDATITSTIKTATSLTILLKKKLFGVFLKVACVDNIGSWYESLKTTALHHLCGTVFCTYSNPCGLLSNFTCPPQLMALGWTCRCPIPARRYVVPNMTFKIPNIPLPPSIENGDYEITATLMNGTTQLGCYQITASLKAY